MRRLEGRRHRVVVAMSGGVDSSVAAALLAEAGHDVVGVMMKLYDHRAGVAADPAEAGGQSCCGLDDVADARRVAEHLGVPFFVGAYEEVFQKAVVDDFVASYVAGRTPNPCVRCNDTVKFRALLARARRLGAEVLATGHYVRGGLDEAGEHGLWRGVDPRKDQSYFVAGLDRAALPRLVFPLGGLTKEEVRAHARRLGLPVAEKAESQEICFVPGDDYATFVEARAAGRLHGPGPIVGLDGLRLGRHEGLHRYTVGQRRGLGLAGPEPRYVVAVRPADNALVVGPRAAVHAGGLWASQERWLVAPPAPGTPVTARVRHRHEGAPGRVARGPGGRLEVAFDRPVAAVTPGQQLVLYDGDRVLGAATIEAALAGPPADAEVRSHA